jgi:hypothetical protein
MLQKVFKILIHPVFIFVIIAFLECIPYYSDVDKVVFHEMPKVGDNFKVKGQPMIYYFSGKGKYTYSSSACYFNLGNPSWATNYKNGGIKTIDGNIAKKIPLLGDMCNEDKNVPVKKNTTSIDKYFSSHYLLDNFSGVSHLFSYFLLSISILYNSRKQKSKYWWAFIAVFFGGGVLELIQEFFIIGRSASVEDQLSNCLGGIAGMMLFWILLKTKLFNKMM